VSVHGAGGVGFEDVNGEMDFSVGREEENGVDSLRQIGPCGGNEKDAQESGDCQFLKVTGSNLER